MESKDRRVLCLSEGSVPVQQLLASGVLALMAAPSWAAKGGQSANAKLCEPGGYPGVLFNQQGEAFRNAGARTTYAAKGGQIAGFNVVTEPPVGGSFTRRAAALA
jgi:hypothetical protein